MAARHGSMPRSPRSAPTRCKSLPVGPLRAAVRGGGRNRSPFTTDDVLAISTQIDGIAGDFRCAAGEATLIYGGVNWQSSQWRRHQAISTSVTGCLKTPRVLTRRGRRARPKSDRRPVDGRPPLREDSPVGKLIRIRDILRGDGVLVQRQTGVGADQDDVVLVSACHRRGGHLRPAGRLPDVVPAPSSGGEQPPSFGGGGTAPRRPDRPDAGLALLHETPITSKGICEIRISFRPASPRQRVVASTGPTIATLAAVCLVW